MLFVSQDRTRGCFASVPERRPGPVGMYTVPAHVDSRRLIKGVILRQEE
jgi:tRNA (Thr-GGU) A37 N-methylase